jgi:TIR domain-containing protein
LRLKEWGNLNMATALIIHAPEDALPARALAEKLRAAKLTVVLEKAAGDDVRDAVKGAQVTVALWSPRSVTSAAVVEDAAFARGKTKLVHAQMQNAQTPQQFAGDKSVNLTGWRGEDEFAPWRELANAITERAGVAPLPPPAPRPPSGFFTPGRLEQDGAPPAGAQRPANPGQARTARAGTPPPRASAPRTVQPPPPPPRASAPRPEAPPPGVDLDEPKKGGMGIVLVIVALLIVLGGGAAGYVWWQGQQSAHASSAAFDQIDRNDPAALRAFIAANSGAAKAQAQGALNELEERSYEAASDADTIEALQGFLHDFPQSSHALAARGRIAELQANPEQGADTTTLTGVDQPDNGDQVAPGGATTTTTTSPSPAGAPVQLTPQSEPPAQEPPSAPATTSP